MQRGTCRQKRGGDSLGGQEWEEVWGDHEAEDGGDDKSFVVWASCEWEGIAGVLNVGCACIRCTRVDTMVDRKDRREKEGQYNC